MVAFFHKISVKSHFKTETMKTLKMSIFSGSFSVKQTLAQPAFVTALLQLVHITDINKNKYLMFAELKDISQIKCIFDQFC